jgi:para-nitrobenzyl esterase
MARKGIVAITINYRLNIFGFFSHPELTKESPRRASGNYGLLDQAAALKWVYENIAAFGGDPMKITIAGESAGSYSVSAQMASPLSKKFIAGAIGESGSLLGINATIPLEQAEEVGVKFAKNIGAGSLAALRALTAEQLLETTAQPGNSRFPVTVDGYFFPKSPVAIYAAGEQAKVPLLAGWNSKESSHKGILGDNKPTIENFNNSVQSLFTDKAQEVLKVYSPTTDEAVEQIATDLAGDRFIGFGTWRWIDIHAKNSAKQVYRYLYKRPRPLMQSEMGNATAGLAGGIIKDTTSSNKPKPSIPTGAVHSAEIEYALGNLPTNRVYDWQPEDYKVSAILQQYFANFIKKGDPNGLGVPLWPALQKTTVPVMHIDVDTYYEEEKNRNRYLLLQRIYSK